jgi:hypothetical protein
LEWAKDPLAVEISVLLWEACCKKKLSGIDNSGRSDKALSHKLHLNTGEAKIFAADDLSARKIMVLTTIIIMDNGENDSSAFKARDGSPVAGEQ